MPDSKSQTTVQLGDWTTCSDPECSEWNTCTKAHACLSQSQTTADDLPPIQFLAVRDEVWLRIALATLTTFEGHSDPEIRRIALWRRLAVEAALKDQTK